MPFLRRIASVPIVLPAPPRELTRCYHRLTLAEIDLGFSGRRAPPHQIHLAISGLSVGDPLNLHDANGRWQLMDEAGQIVGQMAKQWAPPPGMRLISSRVSAVIVRRRADGNPEFQRLQRCEQWEVVVPELVYERPQPDKSTEIRSVSDVG